MTFTTRRGELTDAFECGQPEADDPIVYEKIPRCINRAEWRIAYDLKVQGHQEAAVSSFTAGTAVYQKPGNWLRTISVNVGSGAGNNTRAILLPRSYEFVRTIYPDQTATGVPRWCADYGGDHWLIGPTPAASSPFEVIYYGLPEMLGEANQSNWLAEKIPHVLFNAAMFELACSSRTTSARAGSSPSTRKGSGLSRATTCRRSSTAPLREGAPDERLHQRLRRWLRVPVADQLPRRLPDRQRDAVVGF